LRVSTAAEVAEVRGPAPCKRHDVQRGHHEPGAVTEHTDLSEADHHWLKLPVPEWQLHADHNFSELVLWVPARDPKTGPLKPIEPAPGSYVKVKS